jgi:hypothetical protein
MKVMLKTIPVVLYSLVGIISLVMAFKCLFSTKFLPFHEKAAGRPWNEIDDPLKPVILALLRLSGLGFLITAILLIICPIANFFGQSDFYKYLIPVIALIFCTGLFAVNYSLHKKTKADTPWKGSLYAMLAILAGVIISFFG